MYDGEYALTSNPSSYLVFHLTIIQNGGFVKLHPSTMNSSSKGYLVRMKVFPARFAHDFCWLVAQYIDDGIGYVEKPGIQREVCAYREWKSGTTSGSTKRRYSLGGDAHREWK